MAINRQNSTQKLYKRTYEIYLECFEQKNTEKDGKRHNGANGRKQKTHKDTKTHKKQSKQQTAASRPRKHTNTHWEETNTQNEAQGDKWWQNHANSKMVELASIRQNLPFTMLHWQHFCNFFWTFFRHWHKIRAGSPRWWAKRIRQIDHSADWTPIRHRSRCSLCWPVSTTASCSVSVFLSSDARMSSDSEDFDWSMCSDFQLSVLSLLMTKWAQLRRPLHQPICFLILYPRAHLSFISH